MILGTAIAFAMISPVMASTSELIPISQVTFVTSPKWYLLRGKALDGDVLVFRKYSFAVVDGNATHKRTF